MIISSEHGIIYVKIIIFKPVEFCKLFRQIGHAFTNIKYNRRTKIVRNLTRIMLLKICHAEKHSHYIMASRLKYTKYICAYLYMFIFL